jgi:nucleotide-binding universal stress UspA family protein
MNEETNQRTRPSVVVGVDGSAGAQEALRWAVAEGRLRQWPVRVVHAWTFGYLGGGFDGDAYWAGGSFGPSLAVDPSELHRAAEVLLERALAELGDELEGLEIEHEVVRGAAAEVLVSATAPGDLLVVGSRGHGGFAGLLLGSVSQQCVHHARCPAVVVHPVKRLDHAGASEPAATLEEEQERDEHEQL